MEVPYRYTLHDLGLKIAQNSTSTFIVGPCQSGKTILARWIAIELIRHTTAPSVHLVTEPQDFWMGMDCENNKSVASFLQEIVNRFQTIAVRQSTAFEPNLLVIDSLSSRGLIWEQVAEAIAAAAGTGHRINSQLILTDNTLAKPELPENSTVLCCGHQGNYDVISQGIETLVRRRSALVTTLKTALPHWAQYSLEYNRTLVLVIERETNAYLGLLPDLTWTNDYVFVPNDLPGLEIAL